jgi:hypothetical protein
VEVAPPDASDVGSRTWAYEKIMAKEAVATGLRHLKIKECRIEDKPCVTSGGDAYITYMQAFEPSHQEMG